MLGGAAAAGQNPEGGFWGGVGNGARAVQANAKQQDLMRQQQAQKDFENKNAADKNARENSAANSEETLREAQIAQANAETYRSNVLTQGATLEQHDTVAKAGQQHFADYDAAGLKPIFKDIPETDMQQTIANRPGASTYDWEATGVKPVLNAQGNPTYVYTYSAYDPKGQIPVSQGTIDQWKKDGMDKMFPELFNVVKAGKPIDATQYIELKRTDEKLYNDTLTRQKNDQNTAEGQARIAAQNATAAHEWAETTHARAETGQIIQTKNETAALDNALTELSDPKRANGDFSKLSPKSKVVIGESAKVLLPSLQQEAKDALTADPTDASGTAKAALQQMDTIRGLALQALTGTGESTDPKVAATVASLKGKTAAEVAAALQNPLIPEASKPAIWQGLGLNPPAAEAPKPGLLKKAADVYTEATGAMQSGTKKAVGALNNWIDTGSPFTPPHGQ